MIRFVRVWLVLGALGFGGSDLLATENAAANVVVLANAADPDSVRIAQHYAKARSVPGKNVLSLELPLGEAITWREFVVALWNPLLKRLVADGWIDAIEMDATDAIGRRKYAVQDHRIEALVLCRGVPLKIAHAAEFFAPAGPFAGRAEFRTNEGSVDGELSLLGVPQYAINALVPNPLYQNERPTVFERRQVVRVSRLDGPSVEDVIGLVDHALAAERTGLLGRAYVDVAARDRQGDDWLESVARQLDELRFEVTVDRAGETFASDARFDAPVLYFGWYTGSMNGPFALPGFRFPPGAIALHIHSFSASTLRSPVSGWAGPLVARGVTATVGNVYEPYLQFTHRPHLLLRALARGVTWIEAAYYSLPALSWQASAIGDPLYRPFAVPLAEQLRERGELPPRLAGYAALRRARELDATNQRAEATAVLVAAQREQPLLATGVALAGRFLAEEKPELAANALGFAPLLKSFPTDQWALARQAAQLLEKCGRPARAVDVWRTLLATDELPERLRIDWLAEASAAAHAARETDQARDWERLRERLLAVRDKK